MHSTKLEPMKRKDKKVIKHFDDGIYYKGYTKAKSNKSWQAKSKQLGN